VFIVLEGVDGCGKSTHAKLLAKWIEESGKKIHLTAEPTKGEIGKLIRKVLSGKKKVDPLTLALLFTADRSEHVKEIKKKMEEGHVVISDRYYHSTVSYQAAQGVNREVLLKMNGFAPEPDIIIFLDIPADEAEERAKSGEIFEKKEFLEKVRGEYMRFKDLKVIDATRDKKTVQEEIRGIVSEVL
jgi:dTMP kinase